MSGWLARWRERAAPTGAVPSPAVDDRERSGTSGTSGFGTTSDADICAGIDAADRQALAHEGGLDLDAGDEMAATIAEARALAGLTRQGKECAEDESRCDCGGCIWRRP